MKRIYLDNNATTRCDATARAAMLPFLDEEHGNPSSIHAEGRRAREAIERARDRVAALVGSSRDEIVFTSGGTEGNHLAIRGLAEAARASEPRRLRVLSSPLEHPSVMGAVAALARHGFVIEQLRVDALGRIDLDDALGRLDETVALLTLQRANHELGNLFDVAQLARRARERGTRVHSDAVQAAGKIPVDVQALGVDALTVSAHKLHGPKGVGAVWLRSGVTVLAQTSGGHQERERRPGTENVAGIVGFGAAAEVVTQTLEAVALVEARLRDRLQAGALALGARVNGDPAARVPNTTNLSFPGVEGELLVEALDLAGVACSTGAACTSGSLEPSPVVLALGQSRAQAKEAVRFSLGRDTRDEDIDRVLELLPRLLEQIRSA